MLLTGYFRNKSGIGGESLVGFRMLAHIVNMYMLDGAEGGNGILHLVNDALAGVVKDPVGEIVEAGWVAVYDTAAIAQGAKLTAEIGIA